MVLIIFRATLFKIRHDIIEHILLKNYCKNQQIIFKKHHTLESNLNVFKTFIQIFNLTGIYFKMYKKLITIYLEGKSKNCIHIFNQV